MHKKIIAIITLHRVYNFGSALQTYATQKIFERHDCTPIVIDYRRKQDLLKNRIFMMDWGNQKSLSVYVKKIIYMFFRSISIIKKEMTIGRFIRRRINLSKKFSSYEQLSSEYPKADIYVTGSDQTWNSKYNNGIDPAYFWGFLRNERIIAYAASIGKTEFDDSESSITKKFLEKYDAISVREKSAKELLTKLGFSNTECILDPTLQLSKDEWKRIISKRLIKQRYVLLMILYNEDNNATEIARNIANRRGIKLVKVSWDLKKDKNVDILMTHRTPEDFLSLIYYADFIVTNSYHGICFSINFEKQFLAIKRDEFNTRLESILETVGLFSRLVTIDNYLKVTDEVIEYEVVNERIEIERRKADAFLKNVLS